MEDCIFCKIVKGEIPCAKIYEDEKTFVFLDINPVNIGHALVISKKHFINIYDTPEDITAGMAKTAKKISRALQSIGAGGVNIIMNNEKAAGQLVFHTHIHVIPRFEGDGFIHWHGKRPYKDGEMNEVAKKIISKL